LSDFVATAALSAGPLYQYGGSVWRRADFIPYLLRTIMNDAQALLETAWNMLL
jgi:hypothetical protein